MTAFLKDLVTRLLRTETLAVIAALVIVATGQVTNYQTALAIIVPVASLVLGRSHVKAANSTVTRIEQYLSTVAADLPAATEAVSELRDATTATDNPAPIAAVAPTPATTAATPTPAVAATAPGASVASTGTPASTDTPVAGV